MLLRVLEIFIAHLGRGSGKAAIPDFFNAIRRKLIVRFERSKH